MNRRSPKGIIKKTKQMISRINNNIVLVDFMLDSQRNKLMRMQVRLEIFGVVCGVAAAIGGIFGMNFETSMKSSYLLYIHALIKI